MKELFVIDLKDYKEGDHVFRRPSARAIIFTDDHTLALVYSTKEKYFKFPGGGIKKEERPEEALIREVKEETGLIVIPDTIKEFGSVIRRQKSALAENTIFEQENDYYFCKAEQKITSQDLDAYEAEAGYELRYTDIKEAIQVNAAYHSTDLSDQIMIDRERRVLELIGETRKKV